MTLLNIGQVAKRTRVTVETVRFYEQQGLIDAPQRSETGYRQSSSSSSSSRIGHWGKAPRPLHFNTMRASASRMRVRSRIF